MDQGKSHGRDWMVFAILALAALLRLWMLGSKPPHFDEGVNGWFVDQITRQGSFHYDPGNYHGPLHFYVLFLSQTLFGRSILALRIPIVLVSLATVYLIILFDRFVGRKTALIAALAMAVSPGAIFYGRYAIHEPWLVFFLLLFTWGLAGLYRFGSVLYLRALVFAVTGMILVKETYVIHLACFALAAACLWLWELWQPNPERIVPQSWSWRDLTIALSLGVVSILFFYSGTFLDFSSLKGLYQTYERWFQKGKDGEGHSKEARYWLDLLLRYEYPVLISLITSLVLFWFKRTDRLIRYLTIYGWGTLVAYSIIHYKTPWCVIALIWPFFFLFAAGAVDLARHQRTVAFAAVVLLLLASLIQASRLNYFRYTDEREPYVYVQTFEDINKLMKPLHELVARNPSNYHMTGHVMLSSYHPLPWLLGDFTRIGYYGADLTPGETDADFLLVDGARVESTERGLKQSYFKSELRLRSAQDPAELYLSVRRFATLFPNRVPEFRGNE